MSRCRCPAHRPPDRCPECLPTAAAALRSTPRAARTDTLPADPPLRPSDSAAATLIPSIAALAGSPPVRHWYGLQNLARPRAIVSPHGRPHPSLLPCSTESTADRCWDVAVRDVAA